MFKNLKKMTSLTLLYTFTISLFGFNPTSTKAVTNVPEYNKIINGYAYFTAKYKDKTLIEKEDGTFFYNGSAETRIDSDDDYYMHVESISTDKVIAYGIKANVISLETGKVLYSVDDKQTAMKSAIDKRYPTSDYDTLVVTYKEYNNELWGMYYAVKNDYSELHAGIVKEDGTIYQIDDIGSEFVVDKDNIYYVSSVGDTYDQYKYNVMAKSTGTVTSSYSFTSEGFPLYIGANYVVSYNFKNVYKYQVLNGKIQLVETAALVDNYSLNCDIYGNSFILENGYVKKLSGNKWVEVYKVDTKLDRLTVYDETHIVLSGVNTDGNGINTIINAVTTTSDWKTHWASAQIQYAMDKGWVNAVDTFRPDAAITRAEFVKIVNKACGFTAKSTSESFTDVSSSSWYYNEVLIALKAGYISSKNTTFRPNDPITREEVAAIVTTIKGNKDNNLDKLASYSDANQVSSWAKSSVEGAIEAGYMGTGTVKTFYPKKNITRAESIVTLTRVVK